AAAARPIHIIRRVSLNRSINYRTTNASVSTDCKSRYGSAGSGGRLEIGMTRRGLLLFAAMCVIWGIPYLLIRVAVGEISPAMLVFVRTGVAALILVPVVLAKGGLSSIGRRWIPLLFFAAVEVAMPWFFLSSAEQRISSSLAGLLLPAV